MRLTRTGVLIATVLLSFAAPLYPAEPPLQVIDVVDGNVVILRKDGRDVIVRMLGVGPAPNAEKHPYESVLYLRLLLKGHRVYLKSDPAVGGRDVNGRAVGYLFREGDGEFINLRMITDGYSTATRQSPYEYRSLFEISESSAKKYKRGLWTEHAGSERWETGFKNVRFLGEVTYTPRVLEEEAKSRDKRATTKRPTRTRRKR